MTNESKTDWVSIIVTAAVQVIVIIATIIVESKKK